MAKKKSPTPRPPTTRAARAPRSAKAPKLDVAGESAAIYPDTNEGPPTPDQIAEEAYRIYQDRGGHGGQDLDDWLEAERRLSRPAAAAARKKPTRRT